MHARALRHKPFLLYYDSFSAFVPSLNKKRGNRPADDSFGRANLTGISSMKDEKSRAPKRHRERAEVRDEIFSIRYLQSRLPTA